MEQLQPIAIEGKQFTAWHYLNDNKTTEIFYGGAAGGGKSFLGSIWHIYKRTQYPNTRGLIGRATLTALEGSTLITFFEVCRLQGYTMGIHYTYNQQKNIINWANGSQTILKDLFQKPSDPDFISLGSTEYTDAFIDEGSEISHKAFDIINSRLRWKLKENNLIPKVLVTCNPSPCWIKDFYIQDPKTKDPIKLKPYQKFVTAMLDDNPDEDFQKLYRTQLEKMESDYDRERLLYGNWDVERGNPSPFAYQFDVKSHVSERAIFSTNKRIVMSIDFNLQPFACTFSHIWEDSEGLHDHTFDELEIVHGSIPAMADEIILRYSAHLHKFEITGDYMGNRGELSQRDNSSLYLQLVDLLGISKNQLKLHPNPYHENSKADFNFVLWKAKDTNKVEFIVNPNCKNSIFDLRNVQWDDLKGGIVKRNRKDESQRGDYLDCHRYRINTYWRQLIKRLR